MLDKWRDNSLFQETNCSESRKFLIFLEKVYTFESLRFCGIDFQRSIALKEIIYLFYFFFLLYSLLHNQDLHITYISC